MPRKDYMLVGLHHKAPKAAVFGFAGHALTAKERAFFHRVNPFGFILFARNCDTPAQVRALTKELRETVGRADVPILIDQEGGRVSRLSPQYWPKLAAARTFGEAYERNPEEGIKLVRENALMLGKMLASVGITVNCAPCCDLFLPQTTKAIGDRAYSADPAVIAAIGAVVAEEFREAGILPVIKHMPGHGRAETDSHEQLPVVKTPLSELEATDFAVFRALSGLPLGMSSHVVYTALDPSLPATLSPTVVRDTIRGSIGFRGFLFSDDIVMKALSGDRPTLALQALFAGMDCILHCNGDLAEMEAIADAIPLLSDEAQLSWDHAKAWLTPGRAAPVPAGVRQ